MIKMGTIHLLDKTETIVRTELYSCPLKRNEIIDKWKKFYAKGFNDCFIQIVPTPEPEYVKEDGTNKKKPTGIVYIQQQAKTYKLVPKKTYTYAE